MGPLLICHWNFRRFNIERCFFYSIAARHLLSTQLLNWWNNARWSVFSFGIFGWNMRKHFTANKFDFVRKHFSPENFTNIRPTFEEIYLMKRWTFRYKLSIVIKTIIMRWFWTTVKNLVNLLAERYGFHWDGQQKPKNIHYNLQHLETEMLSV